MNSPTGREMLGRLNDEQMNIIFTVMDPDYWQRRFKLYPADLELVRTVVREGSL